MLRRGVEGAGIGGSMIFGGLQFVAGSQQPLLCGRCAHVPAGCRALVKLDGELAVRLDPSDPVLQQLPRAV